MEITWEILKLKKESMKKTAVYVDSEMSSSRQCGEAIKKANKMIGYIVRSVELKSREVMLKLYNALVRPHQEYCVQFWSPRYKKGYCCSRKSAKKSNQNYPGFKRHVVCRQAKRIES